MIYTTQGLMTAADVAEIRADYDLDLCGCCEASTGASEVDESVICMDCGHDLDAHV